MGGHSEIGLSRPKTADRLNRLLGKDYSAVFDDLVNGNLVTSVDFVCPETSRDS